MCLTLTETLLVGQKQCGFICGFDDDQNQGKKLKLKEKEEGKKKRNIEKRH